MTETDARNVLLIRAFETVPSPAWSADDADRATAEARRMEGEHASFERFVVRRADAARFQLERRETGVAAALAALTPHAWLGWFVVLVAFALGVAGDRIGPSDRINILAPPLLAVLVWNLAVYLVLLLQSAVARRADRAPGPLRALFLRIAAFLRRAAGRAAASRPLGRFVGDWVGASGAIQGARVAFVLHAGAAALVVGALLSLYLRGIAYEYRAGWDSTFLTPRAVHRLLEFVLGPAARVSSIALPDVDHLAQLRFSAGSGENAARWIHLYALTTGLVIVLPRTLLATFAAWRVRSLAQLFPLTLDDDYFVRLRRMFSGATIDAVVLPYSFTIADTAKPALQTTLDRILGPPVSLVLAAPLPQGAEDDLQPWLGAEQARVVVALFALTATPESETHGAFVRALAAHRVTTRLIVLVDESDFRRRFTGADGIRRVEERRSAWQRVLGDVNAEPVFVDLAPTT
ncbi:MAG TPA: DUF2868 domain-containing protein [Burkholderiaceae bacterium]|nr:DUF2868 domain-containing protein [Burkholderiaceae bacterium]